MPRPSSSRLLSCGIVILNPAAEILLGHVTGQRTWDLPKGGGDPGEKPLETALRETREETGLVFAPDDVADLGSLPYTPRKDLHLYVVCVPRLDPRRLHCSTHYVDRDSGRSRPEMDAHAWFGFDRLTAVCRPSLARLLLERLDLGRWVRPLRADTPGPTIVLRA